MSNLITVNIINETGVEMYVLFKRKDMKSTYLNFLPSKDKQPFWDDYDIKKSNLYLSKKSTKSFNYPIEKGLNGTIYLSPHPLAQDLSGYKTAVYLFDQIEVFYNGTELKGNGFIGEWKLSNSNFFGLPMQVKSREKSIGFLDYVTRGKMMTHFLEMNTIFNTYQMPRYSKNINRWLSPASKDPRNIWKKAISHGLGKLSGQHFYYEEEEKFIACFFEKSTNNSIEVIEVDIKNEVIEIREFTIKNIDTFSAIRGTLFPEIIDYFDIIELKPNRAPPLTVNDGFTIKSGALIAAAINRGVLYDTSLWDKRSERNRNEPVRQYYQSNSENFGQFNIYSKILHEHSKQEQCFGFCYDHLFGQGSILEAYKNMHNGPDVEITLLPF